LPLVSLHTVMYHTCCTTIMQAKARRESALTN
jgi:hypothetical protein